MGLFSLDVQLLIDTRDTGDLLRDFRDLAFFVAIFVPSSQAVCRKCP
jgi:hypothetical protein